MLTYLSSADLAPTTKITELTASDTEAVVRSHSVHPPQSNNIHLDNHTANDSEQTQVDATNNESNIMRSTFHIITSHRLLY